MCCAWRIGREAVDQPALDPGVPVEEHQGCPGAAETPFGLAERLAAGSHGMRLYRVPFGLRQKQSFCSVACAMLDSESGISVGCRGLPRAQDSSARPDMQAGLWHESSAQAVTTLCYLAKKHICVGSCASLGSTLAASVSAHTTRDAVYF